MVQVPLQFEDAERLFADLPASVMKNRILEQNTTQAGNQVFLARPGTQRLGVFGDGPIRGTYSLKGLHDDAAFIVSGNALYRYNADGTTIAISGFVFGDGDVSMTGVVGADYQRLFIADGSHLQLYAGGSHAAGTLTGTGHVADGDTIQIGTTYYEWTDTVTTGDGTSANPWKVLRGSDLATDLENMVKAISFTGVAGVDYSSDLGGQNGDVTAVSDATTMTVTARTDLAAGNLIATTVPTGTAVTWGDVTLTGGGTHALSGVEVPDGLPPGSLGTLKGYVIITIIGSDRFYWLEPGSVSINGLDFATAEAKPDSNIKVLIVGDTAAFVGADSIEFWYLQASGSVTFAPIAGRTTDIGAVDGTPVEIKGTLFLVGSDGIVYSVSGGLTPISNHGVEELIRKTLEAE